MIKIFVLLIFLLCTSLSAKSYPVLKSLDGISLFQNEALSKMFKAGTRIVGTNLKFKKEVIQNYKDDFTYDGSVASGKKKISGTWFIKNNMICHTSKKKNKKKCRAIYKQGMNYFELNKKNMNIIMKFQITNK